VCHGTQKEEVKGEEVKGEEVIGPKEKSHQGRSPNDSFAYRPQKISIPSSCLLNLIFPIAHFPPN